MSGVSATRRASFEMDFKALGLSDSEDPTPTCSIDPADMASSSPGSPAAERTPQGNKSVKTPTTNAAHSAKPTASNQDEAERSIRGRSGAATKLPFKAIPTPTTANGSGGIKARGTTKDPHLHRKKVPNGSHDPQAPSTTTTITTTGLRQEMAALRQRLETMESERESHVRALQGQLEQANKTHEQIVHKMKKQIQLLEKRYAEAQAAATGSQAQLEALQRQLRDNDASRRRPAPPPPQSMPPVAVAGPSQPLPRGPPHGSPLPYGNNNHHVQKPPPPLMTKHHAWREDTGRARFVPGNFPPPPACPQPEASPEDPSPLSNQYRTAWSPPQQSLRYPSPQQSLRYPPPPPSYGVCQTPTLYPTPTPTPTYGFQGQQQQQQQQQQRQPPPLEKKTSGLLSYCVDLLSSSMSSGSSGNYSTAAPGPSPSTKVMPVWMGEDCPPQAPPREVEHAVIPMPSTLLAGGAGKITPAPSNGLLYGATSKLQAYLTPPTTASNVVSSSPC